ncbi:MAG: phosphate/phosphite/phosphonate ABC transporter substrate-binding protein [Chloroflexi bacterium]|nr:phosphate/phosphite/phosphonate ABC transporter substrate-binding protein [Chloroflexota bacterium]
MKKILLVLSLAVFGCSLPVTLGTPTPIPTLTPAGTPSPIQTPLATPEPGTEQNPLILALAPSTHPTDETIAAGELIAAFLESRTGYRVVSVASSSEQSLVEAFAKGNAHIGALSPFAYLLARENDSVTALLASVRDGGAFYGAQIIANREKEFTSYYDEARSENTTDAATALNQFEEKKACWSDEDSPSGYVVPFGLLNQAGVQIRSGAFLAGQPSVVRAVYADDICDFGATYIDARDSPALEADYGDVMDRVIVIWRIPNIIPYENISMANSLPIEMRRMIQRAFIDLMLTSEGEAAMQAVYGMDELQVVEDAAYADFASYVKSSRLDLLSLIK